jgi:hypothetical protein
MTKDFKHFWDRFWKDKNGHIAVWQTPNLPLTAWFVLMVTTKLLSHGALKNGVQFLSTAFILIWAYLEIIKGASYFRRLLGLAVFLITVLARFKS